MSLISDALNKAQRERAEKAAPPSPALHYPAVRRPRRTSSTAKAWPLVTAGILVVALGGWAYVRTFSSNDAPTLPEPDPGRVATIGRTQVEPTVAAAEPASARPTESAPASLPLPQTNPSFSPAAPSNEYDLAGMTVVGPNTLLSISRRSDRRSIWIPLGKTVGEITAVSYDANSDRAVIRVNGRTVSVRMRDSSPAAQPAE